MIKIIDTVKRIQKKKKNTRFLGNLHKLHYPMFNDIKTLNFNF